MPYGFRLKTSTPPRFPRSRPSRRDASHRSSDQIYQRADRVPEGCRPGARRLGGAAEHRARKWPTLRALECHQEWQRLDACRRRWGSQGPEDRAFGRAPRPEHQRTVRSVEARDRLDRERGPRRGDRGRAHGADDPVFSRLMAVDPDRLDLDSAVDPYVDRRPVLLGSHAQHHDARRHGARGRHFGRQFDGDDREHPPVAR